MRSAPIDHQLTVGGEMAVVESEDGRRRWLQAERRPSIIGKLAHVGGEIIGVVDAA